jgi:hypothetical protein
MLQPGATSEFDPEPPSVTVRFEVLQESVKRRLTHRPVISWQAQSFSASHTSVEAILRP